MSVSILYIVQENVLLSHFLQWYNSLKNLNAQDIFTIEKANVANVCLVIRNVFCLQCMCVCVSTP